MKIITWNINGYRAITGQNPSRRYDTVSRENKLFDFIYTQNPDIICLQETKADVQQIDESIRIPNGYYAFYHSSERKKGYSGVVTFSKIKPQKVNYKIGIEKFDIEGRIVETHFEKFILMNIYFPKGYTDNERLDYKLEFYDTIFEYLNTLSNKNQNILVCGDYNTAHKEIDLARPEENENTSGFLKIEREKLDILIDKGFIDCFREFTKESGHYTWWSQRGRARENNIGWRIDYHFCSNSMKKYLKNCYQMPEILGSDHCPVVAKFI